MRNLTLENKAGFMVRDVNTPVIIRDERGILFYTTEPILPRVKHFNLPAGKYLVDSGDFSQTDFFKPKLLRLPAPQGKQVKNPDKFKIEFGDNPNKCSVFWKKDLILFDKSFAEKPLPIVYFILFHEWGHRYYTKESYCDMFAANVMLLRGYNTSQIGMAQMSALSHHQIGRKKTVVTNLLQNVETT